MKYGVNRQILLIIAGTVWIIAGGNILRIGIVTWMNNSHDWMFKIGEATIVFLLFFVLIFKRLYYKHTRRIEQKKETRNCPFSFFDVKSWIIMIFMISLGITIRSFHLLPESFISIPRKYKLIIIFIARSHNAKDFYLFVVSLQPIINIS